MKQILNIIFLLPGLLQAQVFAKDTVMSGIYDAGGRVITFQAKVSGNVIIKNAIISANPYIQIADTTVTFQSCKTREWSSAWYGAKSTIADNWWYLQKSANTCIQNGISNLFIADSYAYSQSLKIFFLYKGSFAGVYLNIYGDGDMWSDKSTLTYTGNSFAIGFQVAKGGSLSRLKIKGNYIAPGNSGPAYYSTPFPIRAGHTGIVIDYDGSKNNSGSSAFRVENVWVDGFDVLYSVSPTIQTYNADCLTFTNIRCGNGRIGFQSGQAQEKGNQINNIVSWGNIETLINIGYSGKQQAGQYIIRNGNIAGGCVQLFDISCSGWNSFAVDGLTAESLGRIGTILAWSSSAAPSIILDKMYIRLALKNQAGAQMLLTSNSSNVKISNSNLWYYGTSAEVMNFSGPMVFDNCNFGLSTWSNPQALNIKYTAGQINYLRTQ